MSPNNKWIGRGLHASLLYLVLFVCLVRTATLDEEDIEIDDEEEEDLEYEYSIKQDRHTCGSGQTGQYPFCKDKEQVIHHYVDTRDECGETDFKKVRGEMQLMIQDRRKKMKEIVHSAKLIEKNVEREKEDTLLFLTEVTRLIQKTYVDVIEEIEKKQKASTTMAIEHILELTQEISKLQERSSELERLSHIEDHLHLLQMFPSLCTPPATIDWSEVSIHSDPSVGSMRRAVNKLREALNSEESRLSAAELGRIKTCAVDVTLDPDTAHPYLIVSEDGKQVRIGDLRQNVTDGPERFNSVVNVLAKEGFSSGRFYYEVQVKGKTRLDLGVAIESINRKSGVTLSPGHGYLAICLRDGDRYVAAESPAILIALSQKPQKIGVYVDYEQGQVSFYDVDNRSHIYSFTDYSFNKKLYPFFSTGTDDDGENSAPLVITPVNQQLSINFFTFEKA
ncbi:pyrin-like [Oncorhynchus nerka]|uniref:pyrin-like n=1 Tax=Oncorhynchus nerka TaxID=8023 RepID=UPI00113138B1|nr:pyrin-like [Oncorhynchus nerka]